MDARAGRARGCRWPAVNGARHVLSFVVDVTERKQPEGGIARRRCCTCRFSPSIQSRLIRHLLQTCTATGNRQRSWALPSVSAAGSHAPIAAEGVGTKEQLGFLGREAAMGCKAI